MIKVTKESYFEATKRLREQKKHKDARFHSKTLNRYVYPTIYITTIAAALDCDRTTLYKTKCKEIENDLLKYQRQKNKTEDQFAKNRNTKLYYIELVKRLRALTKSQKARIAKLRAKLTKFREIEKSYKKMLTRLDELSEDKKTLKEEKREQAVEIMNLRFKLSLHQD